MFRVCNAPHLNRYLLSFVILPILISLSTACNKKEKWLEIDPSFSQYIEGYSSGIISKTAGIRVQLASDAGLTHAIGQPVKEDLFNFSPDVKGTTVWLDARTIEFKPASNLKPDELYEVSFKLGKVTKVPSKYEVFKFNVQTTKPAFKVNHNGLRSAGNKQQMSLTGELQTSDTEESSIIEKLLIATQANKPLKIIWQHADGGRSHTFSINEIPRSENSSVMQLSWNGAALNITNTGVMDLQVPASGDFKVLDVMAVNDAQQYASVQFSDPVGTGQDFMGLINIGDQTDISYTINGSEVKVFTAGTLNGNHIVNVSPGVQNIWGATLNAAYTSNLVFENRLPSVKIHGQGNILPSSGKLMLPFEAINLSAVDISIIQIFENNVTQFLQDNDLSGNNDLRRVGKPVIQKTLRLDSDKALDLHKKQRFSVDIDKYLRTEPGSIYRVTIGFRPEYSLYSKSAPEVSKADEEDDESGYREDYETYASYARDDQEDFWSRYDNYYPYGYNWQRRDDPTSVSYYNKDRWATRNILASNIGISAKRGTDNSILVALTSILTTEPLSGVELILVDYQQQIIEQLKSDGKGFANVSLKRKPYLLIAKQGKERGYLRLDDASSLPLSRFDVAGEEIRSGLKGFIFGERGVWRPGDSMFINCIIEDKSGNLPADHPVEFSLYTPKGQLFRHAVQSNASDGFYLFKTNTDAASPTGNWLAKVKVGGTSFEKKIKIETVMPNRLKINFDFGQDATLGVGQKNEGALKASWLFGSPGKGLRARIEASLSAGKTAFKNFSDYVFDNPASKYSSQSKIIFDGTLDNEGNATIKPDFVPDPSAPGMLRANLSVKVFEPGGSFSIDHLSLPFSAFETYAGIKMPEGEKPFDYLLAGKRHTIDLVSVDSKGMLNAATREMQVQFYKLQWRWWWDAGSDNLSNFTQNEYNKLLKTETVSVRNGKAQWSFNSSATEWGRYLLLVKDLRSGHITGSTLYIEQAGWQTRPGNEDQSAAAMLSFTSNKEKYNTGEEVVLNIPGSKGGRMLVSIENGSRVLKSFWQETVQGQNRVTFKADAAMAPNVYATVSLLQPHAQTINDLPIRMYGSIPIFVEDENTILKPVLTMPSSIRPEQQVSLTVSEESGNEMTYCVAIVDEGLLDLTRFKTPDPHAAFYAREALGVKTFDLFDQVIGAWGGDLERILTIGGDADAGGGKQKTANRFKPVVKYLGPFTLRKNQKQTQTFTLPAYIGSVRAMVVGAHKGSYGFTDKAVSVKKPLMLLTTLPRVLAPGETLRMPVTVFAMDPNVRNVNVTIQPNEFVDVVGSATQTISFSSTGEQMAYYDLKVKNAVGIGKIKLTASAGVEKASDETEIDVRNPNPAITRVEQFVVQGGQAINTTATAIGIPALSTAVMEISSIPPMDLEKRLSYLIEYPYGCVEQTTSSVFPQLVLGQLTELSDYQKAQVDRNIKAGIARLAAFQAPDGGFSYWPGESYGDDWGSSYAGHFLLEASRSGYVVSDQIIQQWKNYQTGRATSWVPSTDNFYGGDLAQAYRLYGLALAKAANVGAMNRLREFKYISPEAKWRLAAAYKLIGQENTALDLTSRLPAEFPARTKPGFTYGSNVRDQAMALETLTLLGKREKAGQLLLKIAERLSSEDWYSTQTTAYALLAIANYCGKNSSGSKLAATTTVNGSKVSINSTAYLKQINVSSKTGNSSVQVTNDGSNVLYVKLISRGKPLTGDSSKPVNNPQVLMMNVEYIDRNSQPVNISSLRQGTDFIAKVSVRNTGRRGAYTEMALAEVFGSGFEIFNARLMESEGAFKSSPLTYQDIRDDRVYTYFDLAENESRTYYVQLNATYPGRFYMPPVRAHAMYDNTISASTAGRWIEILNN